MDNLSGLTTQPHEQQIDKQQSQGRSRLSFWIRLAIILVSLFCLFTTILMRRWRTTKDEKALGPRCSCLVAQREKRAYSRRRTGSGHTGRIPK